MSEVVIRPAAAGADRAVRTGRAFSGEQLGRETAVIGERVFVGPDICKRTLAQVSFVETLVVKRFAAAHVAHAVYPYGGQPRGTPRKARAFSAAAVE